MRNKKLFKRAIIITALALSINMIAGGCGKQAEEVISESVEEVTPTEEESTEKTEDKQEKLIEDNSVSKNDMSASKGTEKKEEEFTLTEMDIQMLVTQQAFTYESPSSSSLKIGAVQKDEVVHVIGQVDNTNWFKISQEGDIYSFIDGTLLVEMTEEQSKEYEQYLEEEVQPQQEVQQEVVQQPQQPEVQQPQQPEVQQPEGEQPAAGEEWGPGLSEKYQSGDYVPELGGTVHDGDVGLEEFLAEHGL